MEAVGGLRVDRAPTGTRCERIASDETPAQDARNTLAGQLRIVRVARDELQKSVQKLKAERPNVTLERAARNVDVLKLALQKHYSQKLQSKLETYWEELDSKTKDTFTKALQTSNAEFAIADAMYQNIVRMTVRPFFINQFHTFFEKVISIDHLHLLHLTKEAKESLALENWPAEVVDTELTDNNLFLQFLCLFNRFYLQQVLQQYADKSAEDAYSIANYIVDAIVGVWTDETEVFNNMNVENVVTKTIAKLAASPEVFVPEYWWYLLTPTKEIFEELRHKARDEKNVYCAHVLTFLDAFPKFPHGNDDARLTSFIMKEIPDLQSVDCNFDALKEYLTATAMAADGNAEPPTADDEATSAYAWHQAYVEAEKKLDRAKQDVKKIEKTIKTLETTAFRNAAAYVNHPTELQYTLTAEWVDACPTEEIKTDPNQIQYQWHVDDEMIAGETAQTFEWTYDVEAQTNVKAPVVYCEMRAPTRQQPVKTPTLTVHVRRVCPRCGLDSTLNEASRCTWITDFNPNSTTFQTLLANVSDQTLREVFAPPRLCREHPSDVQFLRNYQTLVRDADVLGLLRRYIARETETRSPLRVRPYADKRTPFNVPVGQTCARVATDAHATPADRQFARTMVQRIDRLAGQDAQRMHYRQLVRRQAHVDAIRTYNIRDLQRVSAHNRRGPDFFVNEQQVAVLEARRQNTLERQAKCRAERTRYVRVKQLRWWSEGGHVVEALAHKTYASRGNLHSPFLPLRVNSAWNFANIVKRMRTKWFAAHDEAFKTQHLLYFDVLQRCAPNSVRTETRNWDEFHAFVKNAVRQN